MNRAAGREQLLHHWLEPAIDLSRLQRGAQYRHVSRDGEVDERRHRLEPLGDEHTRNGKREELGENPASFRLAERAQVRDLGFAEDLDALRGEASDVTSQGKSRTRDIRILDLAIMAVGTAQLFELERKAQPLDQLADGYGHVSSPRLSADRTAGPAHVQTPHSAQLRFEVSERQRQRRAVVAPRALSHQSTPAADELELDATHPAVLLEPDDAGDGPR